MSPRAHRSAFVARPRAAPTRVRGAAALVLALALAPASGAGCAATPCPAGVTGACGAASWVPSAEGAAYDGAGVRLVAVDAAGGARDGTDALALGRGPVLLRFADDSALAHGAVERAVLSLAPHRAWRVSSGRVALYARGVRSPWTAESVGAGALPELAPEPAGAVLLPVAVRAPLRIDVTAAVRAWQRGVGEPRTLALSASAPGVAFASPLADDPRARPTLEIVLR